MRDDLPAAAMRLMQSGTVRTHERIFYNSVQGSKLVPQVIVNGQRFASRLAVRKRFRIGSQTLQLWFATGKAKFA